MEPLRPGEPDDFTDDFSDDFDDTTVDFGDDAAEPERLDTTRPASPPSTARRVAIGAIAVGAAALVAATVFNGPNGESATEPVPTPVPTSSSSSISWPSPRTPTLTPRWPSVFSTDGFLADVDLVVFARSSRSVYRIETRAKRITRTRIPGLESVGPLAFLATPDRVILRPYDEGAGFAVTDGRSIRPLSGPLAEAGEYLPGPTGYVWRIDPNVATFRTARLIDGAGRRVHSTVKAPAGGEFSADGTGGLLYNAVGGSYQATASGLRRVTTGRVVATSRERFLVVECDARFTCKTYVLDRGTGTRRRVAPIRPDLGPQGLLSPDGRHAALQDWGAGSNPSFTILEVESGKRLANFPDNSGTEGSADPSATWLPDGRLLWLRDSQLAVFDPRTRSTISPTVRQPPLVQLALQPPTP